MTLAENLLAFIYIYIKYALCLFKYSLDCTIILKFKAFIQAL